MNAAVSEFFFRLLRIGLGTGNTDGNIPVCVSTFNTDAIDCLWEEMRNTGRKQGVAAILLDGLQRLKDTHAIPNEVLPSMDELIKWMNHTMLLEKQGKKQSLRAIELSDVFEKHGIRTIVLKGIAVAINYPKPLHRPCGDLDCFLMNDYERGNIIAEGIGAKVTRNFYKHSHIKFKGLTIENHQFCTAIRGSKKMKAFERLLQTILQEEGTRKIGETALECPSPMFNALFLTHHAHRHLLSEGIALRYLCDWAMLIHKQGHLIDWRRFKSSCDTYGMSRFADAMTRLSKRLLGVEIPATYDIGKDDEADNALLREMLRGMKITPSQGSLWIRHQNLLKDLPLHHRRFKQFSDTSFFRHILQLVYGFCFDRNPRL